MDNMDNMDNKLITGYRNYMYKNKNITRLDNSKLSK